MNENELEKPERFEWRNLLQYFLQGLIIIAPIGVTLYVVIWFFTLIDNILPDILYYIFPNLMTASDGSIRTIPGLGFFLVIALVTIIGFISSSFVVTRVINLLDKMLQRTPGVKYIYSSVKDFLEAFGGNRKKFDKPVLVNIESPDVWRVGFVTQNDVAQFELIDHVAVYIPLSYSLTGIVYLVPKEKVKPINNLTSGEAMKFVISGGVTHLEEVVHDADEIQTNK